MLTRQRYRRRIVGRRTVVTHLLLIVCCALAGCGSVATREPDISSYGPGTDTAVKRVVPEGADLDVVRFTVGGSGVLIGSRTVLTAGHVGPTVVDGATVSFGSDGTAPLFERVAVESVLMPGFDGGGDYSSLEKFGVTGTNDLQLVHLDAPVPLSWKVDDAAVPVIPALLRFAPYVGPCQRCIRHVGYGISAGDLDDDKQKRAVISNVDTVTPFKFSYLGTCHGDSGGPAFARIDSIERVIGITNGGDDACRSFAMDIRTDRPDVQAFIQGQLQAWDDCDNNLNCAVAVPDAR